MANAKQNNKNETKVQAAEVKSDKDTTKLSDGSTVDFEGAHRSPDNSSLSAEKSGNVVATAEPTGNRYQKVFVVTKKSGWSGTDEQHAANKVAVLSEALNNGSHPLEEATFDGEEDHPDGESTILRYSVKVKPSEENPTSAETLAPGQSEFTDK
jgi:hypothetical protein